MGKKRFMGIKIKKNKNIKKWQEVAQVAQESLEKRIGLWNAIERLVVHELV